MSPPREVARLLADFAAVAARRGVRWYLFGAQAVAVHGRPRSTADVDITVASIGLDVVGLVGELGRVGFTVRDAEMAKLLHVVRVVSLDHRATGIGLDLVLGGPGIEEAFLANARRVDLGGVMVPVISAEDLIVTKVLAGRAKDLDDIRGILMRKGSDLDLSSLRASVRELEGGLDQSDLTPVLEDLIRQAGKEAAKQVELERRAHRTGPRAPRATAKKPRAKPPARKPPRR